MRTALRRVGASCVVLAVCVSGGCGASQGGRAQRTNPDDALAAHDAPARHVPEASALVSDGEAKLAAGDAAGARTLFEQAIAENPNDARAHLDLGLAAEALQDGAVAARAYRRATELDPRLAEAHNNLGALLRDQGELPAAIDAFRAAIDANSRSASAHANLAMALEDSGEVAAAEEEYRAALEIEPSDALVRSNFGLLLLALGRGDDGKRELRTAAEHAQGNRAALVAIGNGLRRAGDAGGAVEAMRAAIAAGDGQPTPALLAELALAQLAAGDRSAAIATLQQALAQDARFAVGHYLLANMYAADQQHASAATHYKKYLQLEPNGPHASQARERLAIVEGAGRRRSP